MAQTLQLTFTNNSGLAASTPIYIGFANDPNMVITNNSDGSTINSCNYNLGSDGQGTWYSLSDLSTGVAISSYTSGRIYVCYGQNWTIPSTSGAGYEPGFNAVTDANFFLRYDKMEITYDGTNATGGADMTSIDFWSIPMSINGTLSGNDVCSFSGLLNNATAQEVYTALDAITYPNQPSGVTGPGGPDGNTLPACVPGGYVQFSPKSPVPTNTFCRILGPSVYPPFSPAPSGIPVFPYDTLEAYLQNLLLQFGPNTPVINNINNLGNGIVANISDQFLGSGAATGPQFEAQAYSLTATIDSNQMITLKGTGSVVGAITMTITAQDMLNPTGIYGCNANYTVNGTYTTPQNDLYGRIAGDFLAGLSIGAVGSMVAVESIAVGSLPVGWQLSSAWWNIPTNKLYANLQPKNAFYNEYSAIMSSFSQAYSFPYSDRFANNPLMNLSTIDTLNIVLEDAVVNMHAY
jgi:hypothetical protein